jgi:sterol desaturase/sphingolipid hydroxylase (fatty acid hydroxylase superfamily)
MMDDVLNELHTSIFVRYPGYIFAPLMLIVASLVIIIYQRYRFQKSYTFAEIIEHTFALRGWKSRSAMIDVVLFVAKKVLPVFSTTALNFAVFGAFLWMLGGVFGDPAASEPGVGVIVTASVVLVILLDMGDYFGHLALHRIPLLWELHKVHHSATFLSPVTSFRVHPLEALIYTACHTLTIAPVIAGLSFFYKLTAVDLLDLMFTSNLLVLVLTLNHLKHSHIQISLGALDYVLISPHMHQLHHSTRLEHWDKNLGLIFSVWDWMFGTAVREDTRVPVVYGIGRGPEVDAQYGTLYGVFLLPVVNMARMAIGRLPAEKRPAPEEVRIDTRTDYSRIERAN